MTLARVTALMRRVARWFGWKPEPPRSAVSAPHIDIAPRASHTQPQSDRDIRPIIEALQQIDPKLNIVWSPQHHIIEKGSYSPLGKLTPPTYDGRWLVIRHETENFHPERGDFAVICVLSAPQRQDGILFITKDGPYAPVGEWVVELMRSADAQNVKMYAALRKKLWAQSDAVDDADGRINEAEAREGLDRVLHTTNFEGGRGKYPGQGADFAPLITTP